jgi:CHAT domain-containing protein
MLLSPAAKQIEGKRLVMVLDGSLQTIPFSALSAFPSGNESAVPLIADHEIVTLPSASVLQRFRKNGEDHETGRKAVVIFADPVFESDDPRIKRSRDEIHAPPDKKGALLGLALRDVTRSAGLVSIPRLPATREEAKAISDQLTPDQVLQATDFEANRTNATSADLANYGIIHFATHALVDDEHPQLSGIVLSRYNQLGQPIDGYLRLADIYSLRLSAELVVLSACRSAIGRDVKGEGLVGLSRGFMYAGVPRVVGSLWKVDDEATSQFMKHFYRSMLTNKLAPAAAFRQAQRQMSAEKEWHFPYYWAGFVFQGEWH